MRQVYWSFLATLLAVSYLPAQEPRLQDTLVSHDVPIYCVAFSPDGRFLASGSPHNARLWDVVAGKNTATLSDAGLVRFVAFSPDGRSLALSTAQGYIGTIKLYDLATSKCTATLQTYNSGSFMAFDLDGASLIWTDDKTVVPGGKTRTADQTTIKLWKIGTGNSIPLFPICKTEGTFRMVFALAFSPDRSVLAARDNRGAIEIWSMNNGKKTATLSAGRGIGTFSVVFSPDGKTLVSGGDDRTIKFWNVATGKNTATLYGHNAEVSSEAFTPDGKILASCGNEKTVRLWNAATGKSIANFDTGSKGVNCLAFSPDGRTLAAAGHDGAVELWNVGKLDREK